MRSFPPTRDGERMRRYQMTVDARISRSDEQEQVIFTLYQCENGRLGFESVQTGFGGPPVADLSLDEVTALRDVFNEYLEAWE